MTVMRSFQGLFLLPVACAASQQTPSDVPIDEPVRAAVIGSLVSKIEAGYVVPEGAHSAVRRLRSAAESTTTRL